MTQPLSTQKPTLLAAVICILASCFYMYEFILKISPGVMTRELTQDLGLNAISLGTMAAFYYYAYTPMQLPAGFLFDRFGRRRLLTVAVLALCCGTGALLFATTNQVITASMGRFLMGAESAFSFIGTLVLVSRWFPARYFAFFTGLVELMSCVGALIGERSLTIAVAQWGWRHTILGLSLIGMILALLILLIVRDSPEVVSTGKRFQSTSQKTFRQSFKQVAQNPQTWFVVLYSFMVWSPITAFATLWGVSFLVAAYGLSTKATATASMMIWVVIGLGCPLLGWWSDKVNRRRTPLKFAAMLGIIGLVPLLYIPHLPLVLVYVCLFLLGLAASGQSLAFGVVKDNNHSSVAGTAIGVNNMASVAGGTIFLPAIGFLIHFYWQGALITTGTPLYSASDFRKALVVLPLCYVIAFIIGRFFIKETYCQQTHQDVS